MCFIVYAYANNKNETQWNSVQITLEATSNVGRSRSSESIKMLTQLRTAINSARLLVFGSKSRFKVLGPRSWVQSWVGGPPKGLQSAAVTLVTSSWRVKLDHIKVKLRKYKAK